MVGHELVFCLVCAGDGHFAVGVDADLRLRSFGDEHREELIVLTYEGVVGREVGDADDSVGGIDVAVSLFAGRLEIDFLARSVGDVYRSRFLRMAAGGHGRGQGDDGGED